MVKSETFCNAIDKRRFYRDVYFNTPVRAVLYCHYWSGVDSDDRFF